MKQPLSIETSGASLSSRYVSSLTPQSIQSNGLQQTSNNSKISYQQYLNWTKGKSTTPQGNYAGSFNSKYAPETGNGIQFREDSNQGQNERKQVEITTSLSSSNLKNSLQNFNPILSNININNQGRLFVNSPTGAQGGTFDFKVSSTDNQFPQSPSSYRNSQRQRYGKNYQEETNYEKEKEKPNLDKLIQTYENQKQFNMQKTEKINLEQQQMQALYNISKRINPLKVNNYFEDELQAAQQQIDMNNQQYQKHDPNNQLYENQQQKTKQFNPPSFTSLPGNNQLDANQPQQPSIRPSTSDQNLHPSTPNSPNPMSQTILHQKSSLGSLNKKGLYSQQPDRLKFNQAPPSPLEIEESENSPLNNFVTKVNQGDMLFQSSMVNTDNEKSQAKTTLLKPLQYEEYKATKSIISGFNSIQNSNNNANYQDNYQSSTSTSGTNNNNKYSFTPTRSNSTSTFLINSNSSGSLTSHNTNSGVSMTTSNNTNQGKKFVFPNQISQQDVPPSKPKHGHSLSTATTISTSSQSIYKEANPPSSSRNVGTPNGGERVNYYLSSIQKAFRAPLPKDYFSQIYREHFLQTCQGVLYSNLAQPLDPNDYINKQVYLNRQQEFQYQKTIIFDLDETLIHCNENTKIQSDVILKIQFPKGESIQAGINIRPFAVDILRELSNDFEIVIFTASHNCYAKAVLEYLDPEGKYIHHKFFRDSCIMSQQGVYIKDLRIFADRSLSDMVLVDNAAYSFCFQIENGIPIFPFYDNQSDKELQTLLPYLQNLQNYDDVRDYNQKYLKLNLFNEVEGPQKVFQQLFQK